MQFPLYYSGRRNSPHNGFGPWSITGQIGITNAFTVKKRSYTLVAIPMYNTVILVLYIAVVYLTITHV